MENLEGRLLLAFTPTAVTQYHNDNQSTGINWTESLLTPSTVNVAQFGKQFSTPVDGQVYAQPLYVPGVNITSGSQQGVHNVVYVATEHNSLYAIDAHGGNVLWSLSFLDTANAAINLLGASSITTVPQADTGSADITVEIGITSTPVISQTNGVGNLYLVAKSKQVIAGQTGHYVQALYKVDIQSGAVAGSTVIADTRYSGGTYTYRQNADPYTIGTGHGAITVAGQSRVYFNALRQMNRPGLIIDHGTLYTAWASHGDNGPYHGWVLGFNPATLAMTAALNTTPNGGLGGIWQGGGITAVDPAGNLYFETGNGTFNTSASNFNAGYTGLPKDGNYGDTFMKISPDPTTSPTNQNKNGWGLKVVDFFSPFNNAALDSVDADLGSGGCTILPDAVGSVAHPHLLIGAGKEGKLYLIDRDNMGGFDPATDRVVQTQGSALTGLLNTAAFFFNNPSAATPSGSLLIIMGYGGGARAFSIANGVFSVSPTSQTTNDFGYLPGSPSVSADGLLNGIMWGINRNTNRLYAYRADNLGVELWNSSQAPANRDQLGTAVKFTVPTVADGQVFVGTANALVTYGPPIPPTAPPAAPSNLTASSPFFNQVVLNWQDLSSNEDMFRIERTTTPGNPLSWVEIATTSANVTTYTDPGVLSETTYSYRVRAFNSYLNGSYSSYTNVASVTTPQAPPIGAGDGLLGAYFSNQTLTDPSTLTRIDATVPFDWGGGSPGGAVPADHFSVRWTGRVQAQFTETYTFYTNSDDGIRLFIKPISSPTFTTVINNWTDHGPTENSGTFAMSGGQMYDIKLEFYENGGGAVAQLSWSSPSTAKQFIPQTQLYSGVAPAPPSNLALIAASGTQINLTWQDNSTIENGFVVQRKDPGGSYTTIATLAANTSSFMDATLNPDTLYFYRVKATNFAADSAYSTEASLTTPIPPAKPTNAHPTAVTTTSIAFAWDDPANNEEGYRISRAANGGSFIVISQSPPNTTSYVDTNLTPGTDYEYHIQAYNIAGYNDFTGFNTATLTLAPTGLTAVGGVNKITLNWTAPAFGGAPNELTYNIYRGASAATIGAVPIATGVTNPAYIDTGVSPGATYFYNVTAVDPGGESAHSLNAGGTVIADDTGLLVDVRRPGGGSKTVEVSSIGQVINLEIWAIVRGANGSSNDEGFQSLQGSLRSVLGAGGGAGFIGDFIATGDDVLDVNGDPTGDHYFAGSPFADPGTQNGAHQDLTPTDGSLDYGSNPTDVIGTFDFLALRSAVMQTSGGNPIPIPSPNAGRQWKIGSFQWVVQSLATGGGTTEINFAPRLRTSGATAESAALWRQDNSRKDGVLGYIRTGDPIVLVTATTPLTADIVDVSPDPRNNALSTITITFSQPVNGFDSADLTLVRDGFAVSLAGASLASGDNLTWTLGNLAGLTDRLGSYTLTLTAAGSGVTAIGSGAPLSANASDTWAMNTLATGGAADTVKLVRNGGDATLTDVYINSPVPGYSFKAASLGAFFINTLAGDDVLTLDYVNGSPMNGSLLTFDGGADASTLDINGGAGAESSTLNAASLSYAGSTVNFSNVDLADLDGGGGADSLVANSLHSLVNAIETVTVNNSALVDFASSQVLTSLTLNNLGKVNLLQDGGRYIDTADLSINNTSTLDLHDNDLIVRATAGTRLAVRDSISGWVASARNTLPILWNGTGLFSTAAKNHPSAITGLAAILNEAVGGGPLYATFDGRSVDENSVLVKYTWNGDADLNGIVDADDYFRIDSGFVNGGTTYRDGDFDYNGGTDADDYFLIDSAFSGQSGVLAEATVADALPAAKRNRKVRHHRR